MKLHNKAAYDVNSTHTHQPFTIMWHFYSWMMLVIYLPLQRNPYCRFFLSPSSQSIHMNNVKFSWNSLLITVFNVSCAFYFLEPKMYVWLLSWNFFKYIPRILKFNVLMLVYFVELIRSKTVGVHRYEAVYVKSKFHLAS